MASPSEGPSRLILTQGTKFLVPLDWNSQSNKVEAIGGGGSGAVARSTTVTYNRSATGGGGGAYAKVENMALTPGQTVLYAIGAGGAAASASVANTVANGTAGGDTYFNGVSFATSLVGAKGGEGGLASITLNTLVAGANGGSANSSIGTVKYDGGGSGTANAGGGNANSASGGGGAAGPYGAGATSNSVTANTVSAGGVAGNGYGGGSGFLTNPGQGGEFYLSPNNASTERFGSGRGGSGVQTQAAAGQINANLYGGGGGSRLVQTSTTASGPGSQGIISLTYTPLVRAKTVVYESGTVFRVPVDWNNTKNTIEVWGGGGGGASVNTSANYYSGGGGGGGAYSKIYNLSLTAGDAVTYSVGTAGIGAPAADTNGSAGGDSYFNGNSFANASVAAKGGGAGLIAPNNTIGGSGGAGGSASSGIGTTKTSGGDGAAGTATTLGGGGGGAGGPFGNGANASANVGGSGDGGEGGTGGLIFGTAVNATTFQAINFSTLDFIRFGGGGGGAGYSGAVTQTPTDGGIYGGGGGGRAVGAQPGANGASGAIVVTYVPTRKQILLEAGTKWMVPLDWNNSDNSIECIGAGGAGAGAATASRFGGGGGGAAYAKITNFSLTPGSVVTYALGAGGIGASAANGPAGGDTWFSTTTVAPLNTAQGALAKGGSGGVIGNTGAGGAGGASANSIGTVVYSGGNGSSGATPNSGAGGGAAGPYGVGNSASAGTSGAGDIGKGGDPSGLNTNGATGAEFIISSGIYPGDANTSVLEVGSGSGGGAINAQGAGKIGGNFGGGGGGALYSAANQLGGNGANGRIIISYKPSGLVKTVTLTSGTVYTTPSDITTTNLIYAIGGGGGASRRANGGIGGSAGGGGAVSISANFGFTPNTTVYYSVGSAGVGALNASQNGTGGGDTWINWNTSTNTSANSTPISNTTGVLAKGGGPGLQGTAGAGGALASGFGTYRYTGGNGGAITVTDAGGGGGGSAAWYAANGFAGGISTVANGGGGGGGGVFGIGANTAVSNGAVGGLGSTGVISSGVGTDGLGGTLPWAGGGGGGGWGNVSASSTGYRGSYGVDFVNGDFYPGFFVNLAGVGGGGGGGGGSANTTTAWASTGAVGGTFGGGGSGGGGGFETTVGGDGGQGAVIISYIVTPSQPILPNFFLMFK